MGTETLEKFFTGRSFMIPAYQRDYAWTRDNIDDLFDDISEAIETNNSHYIGTFILSEAGGGHRLKVVDGQQRMTTISMLLDALIDHVTGKPQVFYSMQFLFNTDETRKLELLGDNRVFFDALLNEQRPQPTSLGQQRLLDGYDWIRTKVATLVESGGEPLIRRWLECIKKLDVLEFVETDEGKAIRMFQSVNDRGVPLSNMDKAKSLLIYYSNRFLDGALDAFINEQFGAAFKDYSLIRSLAGESGYKIKTIDRAAFREDDILRYHYLGFDGQVYDAQAGFDFRASSDFVLDYFLKPVLKRLRGDREALDRFIRNYVNDLAMVFASLRKLLERVRGDVEAFHLFVVQDLSAFLYPLIIRLQVRGILDATPNDAGRKTLLNLIETIDLRVYKLRGTDPEKDMFGLARQAGTLTVDEISDALRKFAVKFMPDSQLRTTLTTQDVYRNPGVYRILMELEDSQRILDGHGPLCIEQLKDLMSAEPSIEHILPQTPSFGFPSYGFGSQDAYEEVNDRLGNLALLTRVENSRCNNESVERKVSADNLYRASIYLSTRHLAASASSRSVPFSNDEIEARGTRLAEMCLKTWSLW